MDERARIRAAAREFEGTFGLRGHKGTFRVSERASYVGGNGVLQLYTQRLWSPQEFAGYYGRPHADADELWVDFAKGTISELRAQVVG